MWEVKAQIRAWYREWARKKIFFTWDPQVEKGEECFSRLKKAKRQAMTILADRVGVEHH